MNGCDVCAVKCWTPEGFFGFSKYSYKYLCTPQLPCMGKVNPPMFLGKDEKLPFLLSSSMGLQHMLAMCVGIATSGGMLHAGEACWDTSYDSDMCASKGFLVSCAWIVSGLLTMIQVFRCKIKGTPYSLGTGLVSVMGTSFTFLPLGRQITSGELAEAIASGDPLCIAGGSPSGNNPDCKGVGMRGYGKFLGTAMVASLFEVIIALSPRKVKVRSRHAHTRTHARTRTGSVPQSINTHIPQSSTYTPPFSPSSPPHLSQRAIFPPLVVGMAVMMIGAALIASGIKYVGGGVFCGENHMSKSVTFGGPHLCNESGDVLLTFGAAESWGLALAVVFFGILIQAVGSPFLKATFLFWSMIFGVIVSAIATYDDNGTTKKYWNTARMDLADAFVFPWVQYRYPLGFSIEYFIPLVVCSWITTAETVGDVLMTCKFSKVTDPAEQEARQDGGVLADGVNSVIACLMGSPPNTTFSQNNGIIALTRCASRSAGFACATWLLIIGLFGKIGAAMASVPMPIVGGVIVQCFTMVFVAGIQIVGPLLSIRRNQYIVMLSLAFGLGVAMEPHVMSGGGKDSFFGKNLDFEAGLWPGKMACETFWDVTTTVTPESCLVGVNSFALGSADCALLSGTYTAAVTSTGPSVGKCVNKNGKCCKKWYAVGKAVRTSLLVILKTPYGIAVFICAILNAILPYDVEEDEEDPKVTAVAGETAAA